MKIKFIKSKCILLFLFLVATSFVHADDLERGRELYKQGNYTEAVRILEGYATLVKEIPSQVRNYAEANYLLAKIYYEAGEDAKVDGYLKEALLYYWDIGQDEVINELKNRTDKLRTGSMRKRAEIEKERQLMARIQQRQVVRLRALYSTLSQTEIASMVQPVSQFEEHEHGSEKVMLDYATGLMWFLYKKPMLFDKAKWWANRMYAGYSGWRLPTTEEALSLRRIDSRLYNELIDFVVWTGDSVIGHPGSIWILKLPSGEFIAVDNNKLCYVWAVRKASE